MGFLDIFRPRDTKPPVEMGADNPITDKRGNRVLFREVAYSDPMRLFADGIAQYNPSLLVTRHGMNIFDKMRKDEQVKICLAFKKHSILSSGWEIVSPEGESEDWSVTRFTNENMDGLEGGLYEALTELMTCIDYGFSLSEKGYEKRDGQIHLTKLKSIKPHSIEFVTNDYGNLIELNQYKGAYNTGKESLPIEKFVMFANQQEFGNLYGMADLEAAYRPWLIKDNTYKWLAMALEKRGIPPLFALYNPSKYHPALLTTLKDVMKNLQAATVGVIPRVSKDDLDLHEPRPIKETQEIFSSSISMFDMAIARALLMPGLIGATSDTEEGSYARAKVHFDVFLMIVEFLRKRIEDRIMQQQIIKPLVDLNYANVKKYPVFRFHDITEQQRLELIDKWIDLVKADAVKGTEQDEAHIRNVVKFPEKEKETTVEKKIESEDEDEREEGIEVNTFSLARGLNKFEQKVNFARINDSLDIVEKSAQDELVILLTSSRDSVIKFVENNNSDTSILSDVKLKKWGSVQNVIGEMLRASYELGYQEADREISGKTEKMGLFTPTEALAYLSEKKLWVAGVLKETILKDITGILFNAMKTGELVGETTQKINKVFEKYLGTDILKETAAGYQVGSPYHIETIIRTNVTDAFNQGRLVSAQKNANLLHGMEYSAVIDSRTTRQCLLLDGKIFKMDDPNLLKFTPPLHFNCRSVLVPVPLSIELIEEDLVDPELAGIVNSLVDASFGGSAGKKAVKAG
tara:strand:+ start:2401 stop:4638 length:2238 start_codon:yes stop_codon:yes gene_type:complete